MLYLTGDSGESQLYNREIALQLVRCDKKAEYNCVMEEILWNTRNL